MICFNCQTNIPAELKFAISKNICPSCGGKIIEGDTTYLPELQGLISSNFPDVDAERLAVLIISTYRLRPLKIDPNNPEKNCKIDSEEDGPKKVVLEDGVLLESTDHKKLQKMRDDALKEALDNQGINTEDSIVFEESDGRKEAAMAKQQNIRENILNGSRGVFRRS